MSANNAIGVNEACIFSDFTAISITITNATASQKRVQLSSLKSLVSELPVEGIDTDQSNFRTVIVCEYECFITYPSYSIWGLDRIMMISPHMVHSVSARRRFKKLDC